VCWTPDTAEPSALVSGGADGQVRIWNKRTTAAALSKQSPLKQTAAAGGPVIKCIAKLDHTGEGLDGQVYALRFVPLPTITNSSSPSSSSGAAAADQPAVAHQLMVATDDTLSFWNAATGQRTACWRFPAAESPAPPIGGAARNPNATVYIFDARVSKPAACHITLLASHITLLASC
jgi:WD40 repeat protein